MEPHTSVLLHETVGALMATDGHKFVDCTAGAGGHTGALLDRLSEGDELMSIDRDASALEIVRGKHQGALDTGRLHLWQGPFSQLSEAVAERNWTGQVDGIMADLGVSSMQLDQADRGFSFMKDGPLDMRMDASATTSAAEYVNTVDLRELTQVLRDYGDEPKAHFIAKAIVKRRETEPFTRTADLAKVVEDAARYRKPSRKHPATRTFQAIRMAVNDELGELDQLLADGFEALAPGGRLAIISFHSLEDRRVKTCFKRLSEPVGGRLPRDVPVRMDAPGLATIVKPFPVKPSDEEIANNPRARSARLRVIEKNKDS